MQNNIVIHSNELSIEIQHLESLYQQKLTALDELKHHFMRSTHHGGSSSD